MGPLSHALQHKKETVNFHMPGHKNQKGNLSFFDDVWKMDTTETYGMDNLQKPEGAIRDSLEKIAQIFGAKQSIFSVNGTTGAIAMGLHMLTEPSDTILVQRDCHKSVYSAMVLNRLDGEWISPAMDADWGIPVGVTPKSLEEKLEKHSHCKVIVVVSPNYYGVCSDIRGLVEVAHKRGVKVMVDEAHGSHLHFAKGYASALTQGADLVLQSTHKTLPAFTQASLLHAKGRIPPTRWDRANALFQTTSPSYLLMASTEQAVCWMDEKGRRVLEANIRWANAFREKANALPSVRVFNQGTHRIDPLRIVFSVDGYTGTQLMDALYAEGVSLEMADTNVAVALASVHNEEKDYGYLYDALARLPVKQKEERKPLYSSIPLPEKVLSLGEAFYKDGYSTHFSTAYGKICAKAIVPYPPGVPLVVPGERISKEVIAFLEQAFEQGMEVLGLSASGQIEVMH